ncbi:MAG: hypothetical protein ACRD82_12625 [Blastocatellia bacterium]
MRISNRSLRRGSVLLQSACLVLAIFSASTLALGQSGTPILPADIYGFSGSVGANAAVEPIAISG